MLSPTIKKILSPYFKKYSGSFSIWHGFCMSGQKLLDPTTAKNVNTFKLADTQ
jgi:hypothetical protein